jgi:hypothetical protein
VYHVPHRGVARLVRTINCARENAYVRQSEVVVHELHWVCQHECTRGRCVNSHMSHDVLSTTRRCAYLSSAVTVRRSWSVNLVEERGRWAVRVTRQRPISTTHAVRPQDSRRALARIEHTTQIP